jgi:hypothetical protein
VVESLHLWKKGVSKVKEKRLTILRVVIGIGITLFKNTTLHPLHPKFPTSISTPYIPHKKT